MIKRKFWIQIYVLLAMFYFGFAFAEIKPSIKKYPNLSGPQDLEKVKRRSELSKEEKRTRTELIWTRSEKKRKDKEGYNKTIAEKEEIEWFEKGYSSAVSGNHSDAINAYSRALELNPKDVEVYNNRGISYFELGKYDEAIDDFTKAIRLNPKDVEAYYNRGKIYGELGKYSKAIKDYSKAIMLNPKDADIHNNRGNAYVNIGNYNRAIKDYDRAIELNPKLAAAYNNRGILYIRNLGHYNQAIMDFDRAIELNPEYAKAYYNRGNAYSGLGNRGKAIENLRMAARLGHEKSQSILRKKRIDW